jgi:hypothetical protein
MKNNNFRKTSVKLLTVLTIAMAVAVTAAAHPPGVRKSSATVIPRCSVHSLVGNFGLTVTGQNILPPSTAIPIATVGVVNFDGEGALSGNVTTSFGGNVGNVSITGTYTMQSNCTGTFGVVFDNGFVISNSFVLVDEGREMLFIQTDQGTINTGKARRQ